MSIFRIIDTSTANVLAEIEAEKLEVDKRKHLVTFHKNAYGGDVVGLVVLHQNLAVLEKLKSDE
jgi:hypothetical protein